MTNLMAVLPTSRFGFYGIHGLFGVFLGLVLMLILIGAAYAIFGIVARKFSNEATGWLFEIFRIAIIAAIAIWFVETIFRIF